ncbi:MAG: hypothetical protein WA082_05055 [Candidatus Moraniibacteriota bacterium]
MGTDFGVVSKPIDPLFSADEKRYLDWRRAMITTIGLWGPVYLIVWLFVIDIGYRIGWLITYPGFAAFPIGIIAIRLAQRIVKKDARYKKAIRILQIPLYFIFFSLGALFLIEANIL